MIAQKKFFVAALLSIFISIGIDTSASAAPDGLVFPVIGNTTYSDDFYGHRGNAVNNTHHAETGIIESRPLWICDRIESILLH